jgi:hypothetical protein
MIQTKIALLEIASSIDSNNYLVIDNTEVTKRATIDTVSDYIKNQYDSSFNSLSTTLQSDFDSLSTSFDDLSSFVATRTERVSLSSTNSDIILRASDSGGMITYSESTNISAYINNNINLDGYTVTIAQLGGGTITIALSSSYNEGNMISYGDLFETAGPGSTVSITRVSDNNYLIAGLLQ